jgi:hypothetical protein
MASIQKRGTRWFARYRDDTGREHGKRFDRKIDAQRWLGLDAPKTHAVFTLDALDAQIATLEAELGLRASLEEVAGVDD